MDDRRIGRALRALRVRRRLTQAALAVKSGIDRSKISRIERGHLDRVPYGDIVTLATALDSRLELELLWRGASLDRLIDAAHARLVAAIVEWLTGLGWTCLTEVSFAIRGERGSIDVFAAHPIGALAVIEAKATVGEANQTLISLDRKVRLGPEIARERGLHGGPVAGILVVASTTSARRRIAANDTVFRASLPASGVQCRRWLRAPGGPAPRGIVFLEVPDSHA